MVYNLCLSLLLLFFRGLVSETICPGEWSSGDHNLMINRIKLRETCPLFDKELFHERAKNYDCHNGPFVLHDVWTRESVTSRKWASHNNSECLDFERSTILSQFRNKVILIIGDSLSREAFIAFSCSLVNSIADIASVIASYHEFQHISGIFIPEYGLTVYYAQVPKYSENVLTNTIQRQQLRPTDAVIFNFGLHYNEDFLNWTEPEDDASAYDTMWDSLVLELSKTSFPVVQLFFVETTPQHFPTENGYFVNLLKHPRIPSSTTRMYTGCEMPDKKYAMMHDWRNQIARRHLERYKHIRIVAIHDALLDQWDSHIFPGPEKERLSRDTWYEFDCTHYCFPSGALDYIAKMLYNALILHQYGNSPLNEKDLSDAGSYSIASPMRFYKEGALFQGCDTKVYYVQNFTKYWIVNEEAMDEIIMIRGSSVENLSTFDSCALCSLLPTADFSLSSALSIQKVLQQLPLVLNKI